MLQKMMLPFVAVVGLLVFVAWFAGEFDDKVVPNLLPENKRLIDNTYTVSSKLTRLYEPIAATVTAKQTTIMSSRIMAKIEAVYVRAGDIVEEGQLLIQLEQSDLQAQVSQAQEKINMVRARYIEAEKNLIRSKDLHSKQLISDMVLDNAKANYQALSAQLISGKQAHKQAETGLSYTKILAPIAGRVVDRYTEPGNMAQPGRKLLAIYNPFSLRIEGQVREKLALTLKQGQYINVELPSINKTFKAQVEEIVPVANTSSRSFLVKARMKYQAQLLPGMYARMLIPAGEQQSLYVPTERVGYIGQLAMVWVNNNGLVQRRFVRLGKQKFDGLISVISGVSVGDKVIFKPEKSG